MVGTQHVGPLEDRNVGMWSELEKRKKKKNELISVKSKEQGHWRMEGMQHVGPLQCKLPMNYTRKQITRKKRNGRDTWREYEKQWVNVWSNITATDEMANSHTNWASATPKTKETKMAAPTNHACQTITALAHHWAATDTKEKTLWKMNETTEGWRREDNTIQLILKKPPTAT